MIYCVPARFVNLKLISRCSAHRSLVVLVGSFRYCIFRGGVRAACSFYECTTFSSKRSHGSRYAVVCSPKHRSPASFSRCSLLSIFAPSFLPCNRAAVCRTFAFCRATPPLPPQPLINGSSSQEEDGDDSDEEVGGAAAVAAAAAGLEEEAVATSESGKSDPPTAEGAAGS